MRPRTFRTALAVVGLTLAGWATPATAEERPHALKGAGQFVSATDFVSEGTATHLGLFAEAGSAVFSPTADPAVFQLDGWAVHTAANGDRLYELISGQLNLLTGAGTATATYAGGTGRFAHATGSATLSVQLLPGGAFEYAGEGTIDF